MNTKWKTLLAGLLFLAGCQGPISHSPESSELADSSNATSAVPDADAACPEVAKQLQTPKNAGGVMFDKDCTTVFVLPPIKGEASVTALAKTSNLGFCPALENAHETADATMQSANTLAKRIARTIADNESLQDEVDIAGKAAALAKADFDAVKTQFDAATQVKNEKITAVGQARSTLSTCLALSSDCTSEQAAVAEAQNEVRNFLTSEFTPLEQDYFEKQRLKNRADAEYQHVMTGWTEFITPLLGLQDQLLQLNVTMGNLYQQYVKMEGATGQILYSIPWDDLIRDFKAINPNLHFSRLRIIDGHFDATSKIREDSANLTTVSALLWSQIPGITNRRGIAHQPDGTGEITPLATGDNGQDLSTRFTGTAHSLSAQIGLSLLGACPYYPEGLESEDPDQITANQLAAHVVLNAQLTYEVKGQRKYDAKYHLSNMVRKVQSSSRRGGFFSTKAVNKVVNDTHSEDWFSITFDQTASEFGYTPEEMTKITAEVKQTLVSRALQNIATAMGTAPAPPEVPEFIKPGTRKIARKLRRCHWYGCRSVWLVSTVAATAARQDAVSEYLQRNNSWSRESVNQYAVIPRTAIISFDPSLNDEGDE